MGEAIKIIRHGRAGAQRRDPAIHVSGSIASVKAWMAGPSPAEGLLA